MQNITKSKFIASAHEIATRLNGRIEGNFEAFLGFVYDNPKAINKKGKVELSDESSRDEVRKFLQSYLKENFSAREKKILLNEVATTPDPAVDAVLETFGKHQPHKMAAIREAHRASMAAESKIGQLLEAYIAVALEPKGWFWCSCNIVKGVDFFKPATGSRRKPRVLQIKNRSNSENSSSSKIRATLKELTDLSIEKWHRIESSSVQTHWDILPDADGELSEEGFIAFIKQYEID
jgi:hypothetical protein